MYLLSILSPELAPELAQNFHPELPELYGMLKRGELLNRCLEFGRVLKYFYCGRPPIFSSLERVACSGVNLKSTTP